MNTHKPNVAARKRRLALKAAGASAVIGSLADKLPGHWQRPLVNAAVSPIRAQNWQNPIIETADLPGHAQVSAISIRAPGIPLEFTIAEIQTEAAHTAETMVGIYRAQNGQVMSVEIGSPDAAPSPASAGLGQFISAAHAQTGAVGLVIPLQRFIFPADSDRIRVDLQVIYNGYSTAYPLQIDRVGDFGINASATPAAPMDGQGPSTTGQMMLQRIRIIGNPDETDKKQGHRNNRLQSFGLFPTGGGFENPPATQREIMQWIANAALVPPATEAPTTQAVATAAPDTFPAPDPGSVARAFKWTWSHTFKRRHYSIEGVFGTNRVDTTRFTAADVEYHQYTVKQDGEELYAIDLRAENGKGLDPGNPRIGRGVLKQPGKDAVNVDINRHDFVINDAETGFVESRAADDPDAVIGHFPVDLRVQVNIPGGNFSNFYGLDFIASGQAWRLYSATLVTDSNTPKPEITPIILSPQTVEWADSGFSIAEPAAGAHSESAYAEMRVTLSRSNEGTPTAVEFVIRNGANARSADTGHTDYADGVDFSMTGAVAADSANTYRILRADNEVTVRVYRDALTAEGAENITFELLDSPNAAYMVGGRKQVTITLADATTKAPMVVTTIAAPTTQAVATAVSDAFPAPDPGSVARAFKWTWSNTIRRKNYSIEGVFGTNRVDTTRFTATDVAYHQYAVKQDGEELYAIDLWAENGKGLDPGNPRIGRGVLKQPGKDAVNVDSNEHDFVMNDAETGFVERRALDDPVPIIRHFPVNLRVGVEIPNSNPPDSNRYGLDFIATGQIWRLFSATLFESSTYSKPEITPIILSPQTVEWADSGFSIAEPAAGAHSESAYAEMRVTLSRSNEGTPTAVEFVIRNGANARSADTGHTDYADGVDFSMTGAVAADSANTYRILRADNEVTVRVYRDALTAEGDESVTFELLDSPNAAYMVGDRRQVTITLADASGGPTTPRA